MEVRGVSARGFALLFALAALGLIAGGAMNGWTARHRVSKRWPLLLGLGVSVGVSVALLLTGDIAPLAVIMLLLVVNSICRGLISPNVAHGMLQPLPELAGSASAVLGCMQMLFGAVAGGLVSLFGTQPGPGMSGMMALFSGLALLSYLLLVRPTTSNYEHRSDA